MTEPVLLLLFNRLDEPLQVIRRLSEYQPAALYLAADGPRQDRRGEPERCAEVRARIINAIDWPCKVSTLFRETNQGCGLAVSQAVTWFFSEVERGIILEDDCLPDPTFFSYCDALLDRYHDDERVMHINGSNFQFGIQRGQSSYYFSRLVHVWGWASWRRAWSQFDLSLHRNPSHNPGLNRAQRAALADVRAGRVDSWAIPWAHAVWSARGLAATPNVALVRNIGYGPEGTHTHRVPKWFGQIAYGALPYISHPSSIAVNQQADDYACRRIYPYGLRGVVRRSVRSVASLRRAVTVRT